MAFTEVEKITTSLTPNEMYTKINEVIDQNNEVQELVDEAKTIMNRVQYVIPSDASDTNKLTSKNYVDTLVKEAGVTTAERNKWNSLEYDKQDKLDVYQIAATNSGITSDRVSKYETYESLKANTADVYTKDTIDGKITSAIEECKDYTYSKSVIDAKMAQDIQIKEQGFVTSDWGGTAASGYSMTITSTVSMKRAVPLGAYKRVNTAYEYKIMADTNFSYNTSTNNITLTSPYAYDGKVIILYIPIAS